MFSLQDMKKDLEIEESDIYEKLLLKSGESGFKKSC